MRMPNALGAAALAIMGASGEAMAWGKTGHEVVCEIALQELNDKAREAVKALMKTDPDYRYFYIGCTWPDGPPRQEGENHYVNLARDAKGVEDDPCPGVDSCVVTAIMDEMAGLALASDDAARLQSLKFLGHWVGDIHEPFHVSFTDDRGGNSVETDGPCSGERYPESLHSVWDSCILEQSLGTDPLQVAQTLRAEVTAADRAAWIPSEMTLDVAKDWANESFAITTAPETEYCVRKDGACWYSETQMMLGHDDPLKTVRVDQAYLDRHSATVAARLKMAGVRLGWLLNGVLGSDA